MKADAASVKAAWRDIAEHYGHEPLLEDTGVGGILGPSSEDADIRAAIDGIKLLASLRPTFLRIWIMTGQAIQVLTGQAGMLFASSGC